MDHGKLLIDETPLIVLPSLAKLLKSLERAMIIQQIHYLCSQPKTGMILEDGEKWIWNTYREWADDYFVWLSEESIRKYFRRLEDDKLLYSYQADKSEWDRRKYYRVNYEKLRELLEESNKHEGAKEPEDLTGSNRKILPHRSGTSYHFDPEDSAGSSNPKTSSKTSSQKYNLLRGSAGSDFQIQVTDPGFAKEIKQTLEWIREKKKIRYLDPDEWMDILIFLDQEGMDLEGFKKYYEWLDKRNWVKTVSPKLLKTQLESYIRRAEIAAKKENDDENENGNEKDGNDHRGSGTGNEKNGHNKHLQPRRI